MRNDQRDTVRQVLEAVLRSLKEDASEGDSNPHSDQLSGDRSASSRSETYEAPVILVVSPDLNARLQTVASQPSIDRRDIEVIEKTNAGVLDHSERKVSHPGLERFTIAEADLSPSAPKTCFMEPGRVCVNSGACQMRGF